MTTRIKLIAMDLDGTLLTTDKRLTEENKNALRKAAEAGIEIVPSTGRFYDGIPACVRDLDFIRYAITVNGAAVIDLTDNTTVCGYDIPLRTALDLIDYFRETGVAYDCYVNNYGYMEKDQIDRIEDYLADPYYCMTVRSLREPVADLKEFIMELGKDIQKVQLFTRDRELQLQAYRHISGLGLPLAVSSSQRNNVEITDIHANKGEALRALSAHLNIDVANTMAFGDGGNDIPMLDAAGAAVAMGNSLLPVFEHADAVTLSNDQNGMAFIIEKLLEDNLFFTF